MSCWGEFNMADKCIECGRFISNNQIICGKCVERQRKNRKLQKLLKNNVSVR